MTYCYFAHERKRGKIVFFCIASAHNLSNNSDYTFSLLTLQISYALYSDNDRAIQKEYSPQIERTKKRKMKSYLCFEVVYLIYLFHQHIYYNTNTLFIYKIVIFG